MPKTPICSRRRFLQNALAGAATAALPAIVPSSVLGAGRSVPPSNRIALGFIGTGSHGIHMNLKSFLPQSDAQVVALCDVDAGRLKNAHDVVRKECGPDFKGCFLTGDWREVVTRDDVDAVVISTPDHWHVLPAIAAAKAGKDVFCEKPLTLTVQEGRVLSDAIHRYGRVFQTASENRSKWNFLRACELVRNGRIGCLHTIRTELPRGSRFAQPPHQAPPKDLDWDFWLGPAPWRPYCDFGRDRCHYQWRWILDYSGGQLTDWGAHVNDVAQWGNDTECTGPIGVEGHGVFPEEGLYDAAIEYEVAYEYANGVTLVCKSGTPSVRFEGSEGWVSCGWDTLEASSKEILESRIGPEEVHLRTCKEREQRDFLNCVKTRREPYYPVEVGHRSVTLSHLGNISMLLGRKLRWDPDAERFPDDPSANRMLSRAMRPPWHL